MSFVSFMQSTLGRGARIFAGAGMIVGGIAIGSTGGLILVVVGAVPLAAGSANVCLFGPLLGLTLKGKHRTAC